MFHADIKSTLLALVDIVYANTKAAPLLKSKREEGWGSPKAF